MVSSTVVSSVVSSSVSSDDSSVDSVSSRLNFSHSVNVTAPFLDSYTKKFRAPSSLARYKSVRSAPSTSFAIHAGTIMDEVDVIVERLIVVLFKTSSGSSVSGSGASTK